MNNVWRQTGVKPKELEEMKELPPAYFDIWRMFLDLNNARASNGFSINPISYPEILAYCQLYNEDLNPWELDVLRRFDIVVLNIHAERAEAEEARNKSKKK